MTININLNDDSKPNKLAQVLRCGLEDGGTYQLRTSKFIPITSFETIIKEFNNLYLTESDSLFTIHGTGSIIVIANTYTLKMEHEEMYIDEMSEEEFDKYLSDLGTTEKTKEILKEMWEEEEWAVATIIKSIAKTGQTINISLTDTLYGNSEYDLTT